jgi:Ras-related GTP-binding protein C/D
MIKCMPTLENLLNALISSCAMEKAFLFDVISKIYVATDTNPVDIPTYELCSDMIDVVIDISCIYGSPADAGDGDSFQAYNERSSSVIRLTSGVFAGQVSAPASVHARAGNQSIPHVLHTGGRT